MVDQKLRQAQRSVNTSAFLYIATMDYLHLTKQYKMFDSMIGKRVHALSRSSKLSPSSLQFCRPLSLLQASNDILIISHARSSGKKGVLTAINVTSETLQKTHIVEFRVVSLDHVTSLLYDQDIDSGDWNREIQVPAEGNSVAGVVDGQVCEDRLRGCLCSLLLFDECIPCRCGDRTRL